MDEISTRAVITAVSIIITITIVSIFLLSFDQIKEIYASVRETDTAIHSQFDDLHIKYDGKKVSAMELLNVVKKFEDDPNDAYVIFPYFDSISQMSLTSGSTRIADKLKYCLDNKEHEYNYQKKYIGNVSVDVDGKIKIEFSEVT